MVQTVLVPLPHPDQDPERVAEAAIPAARTLVERTGAKIVLMSVVETPQDFAAWVTTAGLSPEAERQRIAGERSSYLEGVIAAHLAGLNVDSIVRFGDAVDEVLDVAAALPDPVIVLASHAHQGLRRLFRRSVAFAIVHEATWPVLIVRGPGPVASTPWRTVLVPLDQSLFAEYALDAALAALGPADLRVHLIHVVEPSAHPEIAAYEVADVVHTAARRYLEDRAERLLERGYQVTVEVRSGQPAEEIAGSAMEHGVDLIAMATHGRGGFSRLLFGSVAERLLFEASIPLLLVRPDEAAIAAHQELTAAEAAERRRALEAAPPTLWSQPVHEIMSRPPIVAREETPLAEIVETMLARQIGSVLIVDQRGQLTGIVTESDFVGADPCVPLAAYQVPQCFREWMSEEMLEHIYEAGRKLTAAQVMSQPVVVAAEDETVASVVAKMLGREISRVPVVREGTPVGIVARRDLLKLLVPPATWPSLARSAATQAEGTASE